MSQQESSEEKVKFRDVAACFSEEEWKMLQEWQKEFYKHVMKEIHQAVFLLGYHIVNTDTLLRVYQGKQMYAKVSQDAERTCIEDAIEFPFPGMDPDILFTMTDEDEPYCRDEESSETVGGLNSSIPCFPVVSPAVSIKIEDEELQLCAITHQDSRHKKTGHHATKPFPFCQNDFPLTTEDESTMNMYHPVGAESDSDSLSGLGVFPDSSFVNVKEEEETYLIDYADHEIMERIDNQRALQQRKEFLRSQGLIRGVPGSSLEFTKVQKADERRMKKQKEVGKSVQHMKISLKASLWKKTAKVPVNSRRVQNPKCHMWSEGYEEMSRGKNSENGKGLKLSEHFNIQPGRATDRILNTYNDCESNSRIAVFRKRLPNTQQNHTPYACIQCDKSYRLKKDLSRHMETHAGVRPYACTECDKSFFRKAYLITHYRIHSGVKPYSCNFCQKRFTRKDHLNRHTRRHTGERPYKCPECERSFPWLSDLNQHQRNKH